MITINTFEEFWKIVRGKVPNFVEIDEEIYPGDHDINHHSVLIQDLTTNLYYGFSYDRTYDEVDPSETLAFPMTLNPVTVTMIQKHSWSDSDIL